MSDNSIISEISLVLPWVGYGCPVDIWAQSCGRSVGSGEVVHSSPLSGSQISGWVGKQWMNSGKRNVSYAAPTTVDPQSTALITTTLEFKSLRSKKPTTRERTPW